MSPQNKEGSLRLALQADNGCYWKVHWDAPAWGYLVRLDGTSHDLDDNDSCWFVMEFQDNNGDVVSLRTAANPSGDNYLYLGVGIGALIAWDGWGNEQPTFHAVHPTNFHYEFRTILGNSPDKWLSRVNSKYIGDFVGLKDELDQYCLFTMP